VTVTAAFHFEVQDLQISSELLGARIEIPGETRRWLEFPADETSWGLGQSHSQSAITGWSGTIDEPRKRLTVAVLRVTVEIDWDMTAATFSAGGLPAWEESSRTLRSAAEVARKVVSQFLAWARVSGGQYWIEPQQVAPRLTWMTEVIDASGARIPTGHHDPMVVPWDRVDPPIGPDQVAEAFRGSVPPLADELLADAKFYAWRASQPSPRMAILLAAIAVEVRIKTFLLERATKEQLPLVELILTNPQDISMAARSLYDTALHAVTGRSLRTDDREASDLRE
jgi:hypothetical protein